MSTRWVGRPGFLLIFVMVALVASAMAPLAPAAAAGDVGYEDGSFSGSTPTGREPQSKLWYNDGIWWGALYNGTGSSADVHIHRLDWSTQTWSDTGTLIDERSTSAADTLWDGGKLYIVSAISDQSNSSSPPTSGDTSIRVMRYSYSTTSKAYSLDAGFPVTVANAAVESVSLDKDSTGHIWLTWTYANGTGHRSVYVTHSTTNTAAYVTPYVIPLSGTTNLDNSDYSAIVAYNGKIGVMWSNQTDATMYFAYHVDGAADSAWTMNNALSGPGWADNHMTIKSLQADAAGQVFATTKTSLNGDKCPPSSSNLNQPLILLLWMDNNGGWQRRTFSTAADCQSRPILVLDQSSRKIYLFATQPAPNTSYGSGGAIYYKSTSLDNPNFDSGPGTPFIQLAADYKINNATSTKQSVSPASGLVVLASDNHSHHYVHNAISLGGDTTPPTVTGTDPADGATNVPTSTTVSATFSEPMAAGSLTTASFTLTDTTASSAVSGSIAYDANTQTATFSPSAALATGHTFSATLTTAVTDLAGNHLASPVSWSFGTAAGGDNTPPTVTLSAPADGATVSGTSVTISATAGDNVAVDHVDFLVDGNVIATDSSAPYSTSWDSTSIGDGSHLVAARAVDPSTNSATDTHAVTVSNAPPVSGTIFSDDFETGNLSRWSVVSVSGGGLAEVQSSVVRSGTYAGHFVEPGNGGSVSLALADFGTDVQDLTLTGDFRIAGEGTSRQNIPLFRLFDSSGKRVLSVYRQNGGAGNLHVWDASGYHSTSGTLALNTWGHIQVDVAASASSGSASIAVRLDGALIYQASNATIPLVRSAQIGNETKNQPMDLYVDNVSMTGPAGAPPAPDTTITAAPASLVNTTTASFSFTSSISGSTFSCSLDGAPFTACTSPKSYTGLAQATHAFAVAATANGVTDPTPAAASWTIDTTPPTVTGTDPADGATNVPTSTTVSATFSEPMAAGSLTTASFTLTDTTASSAVSGSIAYDANTQTATFSPSAALATGHTFSATLTTAVTDLAGNHLASPVSWSFGTATTTTLTLFSDDFELGNLSRWSSVQTGGDGTAVAQNGLVHDGSYAAHFTESGSGGSSAYARADLGTAQTELNITGDFRVAGEGASNQNVPLFRLFDNGGTRRLSLYRQDVSGGIYVWDATGYHSTGLSVALNTWAHVELHVITSASSGSATVELWLDGSLIYQAANATLPAVRYVQIGNETSNQPMDLYVDNVAVTKTGS